VLFDKKIWGTFCSQNALINLDNEGIIRADGGESQNVYKELRHYSLLQMAQHVLDNNLDGEFVECGCWRGHSAYCIAKLISNQKSDRKLLIFDSFEGLSERTHHDTTRFNLSKKELEYERKLLSCSEDKVRNVLKDFDFIRYYKGWIPTRFNAIINTKISFLHIDVDLYQPIKDTLEHLYPKIVTGGVIVFDDYGHSSFDGAKKAVDEFLKENKCSFFYEVPMGSAFIIK
jgi:SAM-dependent methyltransferase